jgi:hypothetical protein
MQFLNQITDDPNQSYTLTTDDSKIVLLDLIYLPTQKFWIANITYELINFQLNGFKIVNNLNLLKQFINILPFGLTCYSDDFVDPFLLDDFSNQRSRLYLLNATEIQNIQTIFTTPI